MHPPRQIPTPSAKEARLAAELDALRQERQRLAQENAGLQARAAHHLLTACMSPPGSRHSPAPKEQAPAGPPQLLLELGCQPNGRSAICNQPAACVLLTGGCFCRHVQSALEQAQEAIMWLQSEGAELRSRADVAEESRTATSRVRACCSAAAVGWLAGGRASRGRTLWGRPVAA